MNTDLFNRLRSADPSLGVDGFDDATLSARAHQISSGSAIFDATDAFAPGDASRQRRRRVMTRVVAPLAAAAIVATAIVVPVIGSHPASTSDASAFLLSVGARAGAQPNAGVATAKYWYTKTITDNGSTTSTRESWLGRTEGMLIRQPMGSSQTLMDLTSTKRATWAAGSKGITWDELILLPTDPSELYMWVKNAAGNAGPDTDTEMWTVVWDLLRESPAPPTVRAALFEVAAQVPGASATSDVQDSQGRPATAITRDNPWGTSTVLVDDTGSVLEWVDVRDGETRRSTVVERGPAASLPTPLPNSIPES